MEAWLLFAFAVVVLVGLLYLPGIVALRAFRITPVVAIAFAPALVIAMQNVLFIVYDKAGIAANALTAFGVPLIIGCLCYVVVRAVERTRGRRLSEIAFGCTSGEQSSQRAVRQFNAVWLGIYIAFGIAITIGMYLGHLASPDAFIESIDNAHHLGSIRAFADSGDWSSLGACLYLGEDAALDPFVESAFYPSAWHALGAVVMQLFGSSPMFAANAVNATLTIVVFPCAMFAALRMMFTEHLRVVALGAPFVLLSASCPWKMLVWGPLYPNIMAYCLLPLAVFSFAALIGAPTNRRGRIAAGLLFLMTGCAIAFAQPNGLFAAGVLLVPFIVQRAFEITRDGVRGSMRTAAGVVAALAVFSAIASVWYSVFNAPFMQGIVQYYWPPQKDLFGAVGEVAHLGLGTGGAQYVLAVFVAIGILATLRERRYFWMTCSFLLASLIYVAATAFDGFWHQLLAGFWYTDEPRISAFVAMTAIPLEALGCATVFDLLVGRLSRARSRTTSALPTMALLVCALVVCALNVIPLRQVQGPDDRWYYDRNAFLFQAAEINRQYDRYTGHELDSFEQDFLDKVVDVVEPNAVIANVPGDGSAYTYGTHGLRLYYRYWRGYGAEDEIETPEGVLVRKQLADIAYDSRVSAVVDELGIVYVLQLDHGEWEWWQRMGTHSPEQWVGIDDIADDTPGFETVLSEGDMRLYRIV